MYAHNMTVREAMQRCQVNRAHIQRTDVNGEWRVGLVEWSHDQWAKHGYTTDDLEDAVLKAGTLRHVATSTYRTH